MAAFSFKRRRTRRWWYAGATVMAAAALLVFYVAGAVADNSSGCDFAASGTTQSCLGPLSGSSFAGGDGNLKASPGTFGSIDWETAGTSYTDSHSAFDLASGSGDNSFGQGAKSDNVATTVVSGSIPNNKSDLTRFFEASETGTNNDNFLYLGFERANSLGTANLNFEINQKTQPDLTKTGATTLVRTAGDLLVTFDFTNGGGKPTIAILRWLTSATAPVVPDFATNACFSANAFPCWGDQKVLDGTDSIAAVNNLDPVADPLTSTNANYLATVPALQFGETAIDLTKAKVFPAGTCQAFGSAMLVSRSSASFTAELKDFVAPIPVNISNCGSITIIKHTAPRGQNEQFAYTTNNLSTDATGFHLNDGGYNPSASPAVNDVACGTNDSTTQAPCNSVTFTNLVPSTTYSVTESSPSDGYVFDNVSCKNNNVAVASGSGGLTIAGQQVSIAMGTQGNWVCTYVNDAPAQLTIIKHTSPRGQNEQFTYTGTGSGVSSTFALNDDGNSSSDTACTETTGSPASGTHCNKITFSGLATNTSTARTVTEGTLSDGYTFGSVSCTNGGNAVTSGSGGLTISTKQVSIVMSPADNWVCTYVNNAPGTIVIIKHTAPRGINHQFSYTGTGTGVSSSFALNDSGNSSGDTACTIASGSTTANPCNKITFNNLAPNSYTVNETLPSGWTLGAGDLTCSTDGSQDGTTATQANITLHAGETVTCTYVNHQPLGAILVTKTGKDKACDSSSTTISNGVCTGAATAKLGGATFKVTTDSAGSNSVTGSPITTSASTGTACIDGLPWDGSGTDYYVTETGAPGGYAIDSSAAVHVVVSADATCNSTHTGLASGTSGVVSGTSSAPSFTDTPLTDLVITASAETAGATKSTITCNKSDASGNYTAAGANIGNSPTSSSDPATVNADSGTGHGGGLQPGTYYCKVFIDP